MYIFIILIFIYIYTWFPAFPGQVYDVSDRRDLYGKHGSQLGGDAMGHRNHIYSLRIP